jgi:hypothetical protein
MNSSKEPEPKVYELESNNKIKQDIIFYDKYIYVFTVKDVMIYNKNYDHIKKVPILFNVGDEFKFVKQKNDGSFIIVSTNLLLHYTPFDTTKIIKNIPTVQKMNNNILFSPNGEWVAIKWHLYKPNIELHKYNQNGDCKVICSNVLKIFEGWECVCINNDGCLFLYNHATNQICKLDDYNNISIVSIKGYSRTFHSHEISKDGKVLFCRVGVNNFTSINIDDFKIIDTKDTDEYSYKYINENILFQVSQSGMIEIYDIRYKQDVDKIQINIPHPHMRIIAFRKINNFLIIYTSLFALFVYDLKTKHCIKIFNFNCLKSTFGIIMPLFDDDPNIIIHGLDSIIMFNPIKDKIEQKTFLLGSLIPKDNSPCSVFDFMSSIYFDRHLLPLIFEFLPEY